MPRAVDRDPLLRRRVISALVLAPVILALIVLGGFAFALLMAAALVLMALEWGALTSDYSQAGAITAGVLAFAVPLGALLLAVTGEAGTGVLVIALGAPLAAAVAWWFRVPPLWTGIGVVYLGVPLLALVWLRSSEVGLIVLLWLFAVVWAADTSAYFVGRAVGGPRLAPRISPSKTWSGFLGSIVGAALIGFAIALLTGTARPGLAALLGAALAIVAQAGDLAESALKRYAGVKDSGTMIPGHGGLLDRVDGLMFAAPALALTGLLLQHAWPWR